MNKQYTKEFYGIVMVTLAILTLTDIAIIHHFYTHLHMNGQLYEEVGMIQTHDGNNTLYFPVYKLKGDNNEKTNN